MDEPIKKEKPEDSFLAKYIYGKDGKTLLIVFLIGAVLAILVPSVVNIPMIVVALVITIIIQRVKRSRNNTTK